MKKKIFLIVLISVFSCVKLFSQDILPNITVKNLNGKIIISWLNDYKKPVSDIFVQRSYDSLKNFTTIGSVLIPQNLENGYPDLNPPYNKMYYRVSISFEGGSYIIGPSTRPVKEFDTASLKKADAAADSIIVSSSKPTAENNLISNKIFTGKDNNVVIQLPDYLFKKYSAKFYNDAGQLIFELKKITEDYLIIEKVNFIRSGWFTFELYNEEKLVEKNKILISKDPKISNK